VVSIARENVYAPRACVCACVCVCVRVCACVCAVRCAGGGGVRRPTDLRRAPRLLVTMHSLLPFALPPRHSRRLSVSGWKVGVGVGVCVCVYAHRRLAGVFASELAQLLGATDPSPRFPGQLSDSPPSQPFAEELNVRGDIAGEGSSMTEAGEISSLTDMLLLTRCVPADWEPPLAAQGNPNMPAAENKAEDNAEDKDKVQHPAEDNTPGPPALSPHNLENPDPTGPPAEALRRVHEAKEVKGVSPGRMCSTASLPAPPTPPHSRSSSPFVRGRRSQCYYPPRDIAPGPLDPASLCGPTPRPGQEPAARPRLYADGAPVRGRVR
jgi:hypothetical protein